MELSGGSVHLRNDKNVDVTKELLSVFQRRNPNRMDQVVPLVLPRPHILLGVPATPHSPIAGLEGKPYIP